jgi:uncharacterized protein (DUF1499 family)
MTYCDFCWKWPMKQRHASRITLTLSMLLAAAGVSTTQTASAAEKTIVDPRLNCTLPTNCVNSRTSSGLAPLQFGGTAAQGLALLMTTLASFPEAAVHQDDDTSITAVFTTPAGFRDDVVFLLDPQQHQIDFQSHSRFGLYDFGKNRSRMQAVSARFAELKAAADTK